MSIEFIPTGQGTGAEVRGVSLKEPMPQEDADLIRIKLAEEGVLLFRGQADVTEDEQLAFTEAFGNTPRNRLPDVGGFDPIEKPHPHTGKGELGWHTDLQYMPEPQVYSLLYGIEVPTEGGETEWCNMTHAYEGLDDDTKEQIRELSAIHWYSRRIPPVRHPVVRLHPITRARALYVSPGLSRLIDGWQDDEGRALIQQLAEHATQPQYCYLHRWRQGDALMWDNRCTMHRRRGFDTRQRRVVRRTQTSGEAVISA